MTNDGTVVCPYCGGNLSTDSTICPDCQEDLSGLIRLESGHIVYYNEALSLAREGKLEDACARLLVALELEEGFVPGHILLAKVYARQGRWPQARASVVRALDRSPEDGLVRELAAEIERSAQEDAARRPAVSRAKRAAAERVRTARQPDVGGAFVLGAGLATVLALVVSWIGGRKRGASGS